MSDLDSALDLTKILTALTSIRNIRAAAYGKLLLLKTLPGR